MQRLRYDPIYRDRRLAPLRGSGPRNSRAERSFDRQTKLAARVFDAPITLISRFELDQLYLKSSVGLPAPWNERRQMPLSDVLSEDVFLGHRPLAVANTLEDSRFRECGMVKDLGAAAYLGVPLASPDGEILGVFSVIDLKPRAWTQEDLDLLQEMADSVVHEIQLCIEVQKLRDMTSRLSLLQSSTFALADAECFESAVSILIQIVSEVMNFSAGEYWRFESKNSRLLRQYRWDADVENHAPLAPAILAPGEGIPGLAWKALKAVSVDAPSDGALMDAGIAQGIGVPIAYGAQRFGVMAFLSKTPREVDPELLRTFTAIGRQIGQFAVQKQAESEALRLNTQLQAIVDAATQVSIIATDVDGTIVLFGAGAERMLGYESREIVGVATPERIHLSSEIEARSRELTEQFGIPVRGFQTFVEVALRQGHEEREWTYIRKDGRRLTVTLGVTVVRDSSGGVLGYLGIAKDITAKKEADRELRRLSALVDHSGDFIAMADLAGVLTYINPAGRRLVGLEKPDLDPPGNARETPVEWLNQTAWNRALASALIDGQWFGELTLRHSQTGEPIDGEASVFPIYPPDRSQPHCLATIVRDVRVQRHTQLQLVESKILLEGIFESMLDGLVVIDDEYKVADMNTTAATMFGLSREQSIGLSVGSLVVAGERDGDDGEAITPGFLAGAEEFGGRRFEAVGLRSDGSRFPVEISINAVRAADRFLRHAAVRDISDRKKAEARLLESEELFRRAFDNAPIGMALVATDGRWLRVNSRLCEIVGYSEAELLATNFQHISHPDDLAADLENVSRLLAGEAPSYLMEKRYHHKDGHIVWVVLGASLIRDDRGRPLYFVSQVNDVSERKRAEESLNDAHRELEQRVRARTAELAETNAVLELEIADRIRIEEEMRESEERFRSLADAMPQLVWTARPDGSIAYQNRRTLELVGPIAHETGLESWTPVIHPDDRARSLQAWREAIQNGKHFQVEWRLLDGVSGAYRWHLARAVPVCDEDGQISQWYGTSTDMDDQKRAEEARRQSEDTFHGLLAATHEGVWFLDEQARITFVNPQMAEMLGYEPSDLVGLEKWEIFFEEDQDIAKRLFARRRDGLCDRADIRFRRSNGDILWTMMSERPVFDESGTFRGAIGLFNDITERKKAEDEIHSLNRSLESRVRSRTEELARAKEEAESATKAKGEFLANMSHEVRTPIAAILGYSEMLLDPVLPDDDRRVGLTAIRRNAAYLLAIINDILDLSKIEAGRLQLDLVNYSPLLIVHEVKSTLAVAAEEKGITIDVVADDAIPTFAVMDPTRVRQVLSNLVSNAIKFSYNRGRVAIRVGCCMLGVNETRIRFEIEDHGIGMTPEQTQNLFLPFQQADSSTTRKYGGTGLGLSISRRLTEIMDGDISVRSVYGKGSCFSVEIPLLPFDSRLEWPAMDEPPAADYHRSPIHEIASSVKLSGRVLLAEDSVDNQRVLLYLLGQLGLKVDTVENGLLAVERALEGNYDVVLLDMQMSELDGYQAARKLRESGYEGPIVAITAHAMTQDREKCLRAGCTEFLTKPVNVRNMARILSELLRPDSVKPPTLDMERTSVEEVDCAAIRSDYWDLKEFQPLILEYIESLPDLVVQLRKMSAAGDLNGVKKLAHRLSGSGGMYGYSSLSEAARSLEGATVEGADLRSITKFVERFADLVAKIVKGKKIDFPYVGPPSPCVSDAITAATFSVANPNTDQPLECAVEHD